MKNETLKVRWPSLGRAPDRISEAATVLEFVDRASDREWSSGSGTLGLYGSDATLIVSKKPQLGYMVSFLGGRNTAPGDVIVSHQDFSKTTEVIVGGEPWAVPMAFFIDGPTAKAAIEFFFDNGGKLPGVQWVAAGPAMTTAGL